MKELLMNTKRLALAASMILVAAISGSAIARTMTSGENHRSYAINASGEMSSPSEAGAAMPAPAAEDNLHRYFGGPKSND
jgi:hypothetical protein